MSASGQVGLRNSKKKRAEEVRLVKIIKSVYASSSDSYVGALGGVPARGHGRRRRVEQGGVGASHEAVGPGSSRRVTDEHVPGP